ncbi:hypothetical protein [Microbacterium sp. 22296]|uniref:hypothetical protein n=1 Tax=Microbacterium sp. 22296 TaxID=3453903 RepID=UPI003F835CAF
MEDVNSLATYIPLGVALVAAISALTVAILGSRSDALKRAERLTGVAATMPDGGTKVLVERSRDLVALRYALRSAAPKYGLLSSLGAFVLFLAFCFGYAGIRHAQDGLVGWQGYVSIGWSSVAGMLLGLPVGLREKWIRRRQRAAGAISDDLSYPSEK